VPRPFTFTVQWKPRWLLDSKAMVLKFREGKVGRWFMQNWPVALACKTLCATKYIVIGLKN
jgi:hypothetical protein